MKTIIDPTHTVERIRTLADELDQLGKNALEKAIEIGKLLTGIRSTLTHGSWLPWLKTNFKFSDRTARNWMAIYKMSTTGKLETVSDLSEAYALAFNPKKSADKPSPPLVSKISQYPAPKPRTTKSRLPLGAVHRDAEIVEPAPPPQEEEEHQEQEGMQPPIIDKKLSPSTGRDSFNAILQLLPDLTGTLFEELITVIQNRWLR